jgi:glycosyltransferase involved in cell wall biosynthesis
MSAAILHVETRHLRGGCERNVNHFASWQAGAGHRIGLAVGRDSLLQEVPAGVQGILVEHLVRRPDPILDPLAVRALGGLIREGAWDVVHTHQSKAGVIGRVAARHRARLILHTVHMVSFGPGYGRVPSAAFERAERLCASWTDELIAVGEELRERYLAAGVGAPDRFRVIHSPIDVEAFTAARVWSVDRRAEVRASLGLSADEPVVLAVAALEPRKRLDLVIERLSDDLRIRWRLLVAGDGRQRADLERQIGRLGLQGRVLLLGNRSDVPSLMGIADVFVHAAEAEGVPQVVIQALAAGRPVVATDVIGLRELSGAPISVAQTTGADLRPRVAASLVTPGSPLPSEALRPWTKVAVEAAIAGLHLDLGLVP